MNSDSVDLIYLDPPFNKNKMFCAPIGSHAEGASFKDFWGKEDVKDEEIEFLAGENYALYAFLANVETTGARGIKYYLLYMGIRLMEMYRILKPTGTIYLHCDRAAGHYLKLLMDAVFGIQNFRNHIVWRRQIVRGMKTYAKYFSNNADYLLIYSKSKKSTWNEIYTENLLTIREANKKYKKDAHGFFRTSDPGTYSNKKLVELFHQKRIYISRDGEAFITPSGELETTKGKINIKYYREQRGDKVVEKNIMDNIWTDIPGLGIDHQEHTHYPTQKPLKLLERIIKASSNEGDLVLDPFCGCATTCVAAENLNRQWIGIDVSEVAYKLVKERLNKQQEDKGGFFKEKVHFRKAAPKRTDIAKPEKPYFPRWRKGATKDIKDIRKRMLYGIQEGICNGCGLPKHFTDMSFDHIKPKSKLGTDSKKNLQLLCGNCNSTKGDRSMEYLWRKLDEKAEERRDKNKGKS
ncbi:MAG: DNA methyltransferase [Cytophagales bacterium]|nr:DNA methyltransferase [Cytophagales bacterium]